MEPRVWMETSRNRHIGERQVTGGSTVTMTVTIRSIMNGVTQMKYRASSLCIIRRKEEILLEQFPEEDGVVTYRPIGGTIEYGEDSKSTVIREVKEEIKQDINDPVLIGIVENIFPFYDQIGHEFDFIYEASFIDKSAYDQEILSGVEGDKQYVAVWKPISEFENNHRVKLVPDGLYEMLLNKETRGLKNIKHISTRDFLSF